MHSNQILKTIAAYLKKAMQDGLGKDGLIFPIDPDLIEDKEMREACKNLALIFNMMNEAYCYAGNLANGEINVQSSRTNIFAMPLKALQASLRHLTWQANQVAEGDLNQRVHFLGEFSNSFNRMIDSLREKQVLEQQLKTITDMLGEGILLVDINGCLVFANPEAERLLGYDFDELQGRQVYEIIYKNENETERDLPNPDDNPLYSAIASGRRYNNDDGAFLCKSGHMMPVSFSCRPVLKKDAVDGAVIAFRDITEQKKYRESLEMVNELLEKQATTDPLTGIYNRMKLAKVLNDEMERVRRQKTDLSLIIFDIDKFKKVNDTYGHNAGDGVLKNIAKLISRNIRQNETFARWGGEEFLIVTPGYTLNQALQLTEKLRLIIESHDFQIPQQITSSFGVTAFKDTDSDITLINRADNALYRAKENGRNRVEFIV